MLPLYPVYCLEEKIANLTARPTSPISAIYSIFVLQSIDESRLIAAKLLTIRQFFTLFLRVQRLQSMLASLTNKARVWKSTIVYV